MTKDTDLSKHEKKFLDARIKAARKLGNFECHKCHRISGIHVVTLHKVLIDGSVKYECLKGTGCNQ